MIKFSCLKVYDVCKTFIFRDFRPIKQNNHSGPSAIAPTLTDVVGNCFTGKPQTGIVIGGYFIPEVGTESPEELVIRY
ncbi:hypothetical protein [Adhaeribacter radiodurans]|uniref:Uncharacterized protein n=1 Tax=Adhaeribacter radiodurans TaxID=2745197 RepID=A0A7L7LCS1_9BACT|nr:hypothetical protein [Adhaeribacter radiodurans]QMU30640.1 hypothetical protein HUW48_22590 [Adhaeribacter radiodurans]